MSADKGSLSRYYRTCRVCRLMSLDFFRSCHVNRQGQPIGRLLMFFFVPCESLSLSLSLSLPSLSSVGAVGYVYLHTSQCRGGMFWSFTQVAYVLFFLLRLFLAPDACWEIRRRTLVSMTRTTHRGINTWWVI